LSSDRGYLPKKLLVLSDADLLLQVQLEFEEQNTGGQGVIRCKMKDKTAGFG